MDIKGTLLTGKIKWTYGRIIYESMNSIIELLRPCLRKGTSPKSDCILPFSVQITRTGTNPQTFKHLRRYSNMLGHVWTLQNPNHISSIIILITLHYILREPLEVQGMSISFIHRSLDKIHKTWWTCSCVPVSRLAFQQLGRCDEMRFASLGTFQKNMILAFPLDCWWAIKSTIDHQYA